MDENEFNQKFSKATKPVLKEMQSQSKAASDKVLKVLENSENNTESLIEIMQILDNVNVEFELKALKATFKEFFVDEA